jgi:hypothetical protein
MVSGGSCSREGAAPASPKSGNSRHNRRLKRQAGMEKRKLVKAEITTIVQLYLYLTKLSPENKHNSTKALVEGRHLLCSAFEGGGHCPCDCPGGKEGKKKRSSVKNSALVEDLKNIELLPKKWGWTSRAGKNLYYLERRATIPALLRLPAGAILHCLLHRNTPADRAVRLLRLRHRQRQSHTAGQVPGHRLRAAAGRQTGW